jgi:GTP-binding protein Era
LIVDAAHGLGAGDAAAAKTVKQSGAPALAVLNKIDLVHPKARLLDMMQLVVNGWGLEEAIPVSAATGDGCDRLIERVVVRLPEGPPPFPDDYLTDQPERVLAAEWIREKLLHHTRQEIPHATAVLVERWTERADGLVEIEATVFVERESQKGIVIGKGGSLLKQVGTEARADIERLLGARVFLRIRVEVRDDWRNDRRTLSELGLE